MQKSSQGQGRRLTAAVLALGVWLSLLPLGLFSTGLTASAEGYWSYQNVGAHTEDSFTFTGVDGKATYAGVVDTAAGITFTVESQTDWVMLELQDENGDNYASFMWYLASSGVFQAGNYDGATHLQVTSVPVAGAHTVYYRQASDGAGYRWYLDDFELTGWTGCGAAINSRPARVSFHCAHSVKVSGVRFESQTYTTKRTCEVSLDTQGYTVHGIGDASFLYSRPLDMERGLCFTPVSQGDWVALSFSGGNMGLRFRQSEDGYLRVAIFMDDEKIGPEQKIPYAKTHTVQFNKSDSAPDAYRFVVDGIRIADGGVAATGENPLKSTTFTLQSNDSMYYTGIRAVAGGDYRTAGACTVWGDTERGYIAEGTGDASFTYGEPVNMEDGIQFSSNNQGDWVALSFSGGNMGLRFRQSADGYLRVAIFADNEKIGPEQKIPYAQMHTVRFNKSDSAPDAYRFVVDGIRIADGGVAATGENPLKSTTFTLQSNRSMHYSGIRALMPSTVSQGTAVSGDSRGGYTLSGAGRVGLNESVVPTAGFFFSAASDTVVDLAFGEIRYTDGNLFPAASAGGKGGNLRLSFSPTALTASVWNEGAETARTTVTAQPDSRHTLQLKKGTDGLYRWCLDGTATLCESITYTAATVARLDRNRIYIQVSLSSGTVTDFAPVRSETVVAEAGLSVDKPYAEKGETVTVTASPENQYQLRAGSLAVVNRLGEVLAIPVRAGFRKNQNSLVYTFVKPAGQVFVTASYAHARSVAPNLGPVGWSVNRQKQGLRSVYRMYVRQTEDGYVYRSGYDTPVEAFGILLCAESVYEAAGRELTREKAAVTDRMIDTDYVGRQCFYDAAGDYLDISVSVIGLSSEEAQHARLYTRGYVTAGGQTYYTEVRSHAYADFGSDAAVFRVADFGAVGDGVTEDGAAIQNAVRAAAAYTNGNDGCTAVVSFEAGRTYKAFTANGNGVKASLSLEGVKNLTVAGNGATLLGKPSQPYITLEGAAHITVEDLNFDYDTPVACRAKVTEKNERTVTFEVPTWFARCAAENTLPDDVFAIPANGRRDHAFIESCERIDDTHVRFVFTKGGYTLMTPGTQVDLPTPGYGHVGTAFRVSGSGDGVTLKNWNIYNAGQFVFQVNGNTGEGGLVFENIRLAPKTAEACPTVAWRDVIHAKDNTAKMIFNNCEFGGTHDDIFNLSNTILEVEHFYGDDARELELSGLDYGGNYHSIFAGDHIVAFNPKTDTYYGKTTVKEVIEQNGTIIHVRLSEDIGLEEGAYLYIEERAAAAEINGGTFTGTVRIRASGTVVQNATFRLIQMWTGYEALNAPVEGPIPENITYRGCSFEAAPGNSQTNRMSFACHLLQSGNPVATSYATHNIVFEGCQFAYEGILDPDDPAVVIR